MINEVMGLTPAQEQAFLAGPGLVNQDALAGALVGFNPIETAGFTSPQAMHSQAALDAALGVTPADQVVFGGGAPAMLSQEAILDAMAAQQQSIRISCPCWSKSNLRLTTCSANASALNSAKNNSSSSSGMIADSKPGSRLAPKLLAAALGHIALMSLVLSVGCSGGGAEQVVFVAVRDDNYDILVMNTDGTGEINLTNHPADDLSPAWSPDGRRIAFVSDRDGNKEIYVMNEDGSDVRRLTSNEAEDELPIWSPDGRRIAFQSDRDRAPSIYLMDRDGSNVVRVTSREFAQTMPAWSPDGRYIAYRSFQFQDTFDDIYVINVDGTDETLLLALPGAQWYPQWSPDGRWITFSSGGHVFVMKADGSDPVRLTNELERSGSASWTPEGRIVFSSFLDGTSDIFVVNADGTGLTNLTNSPRTSELGPSWSP